MSGAIIWTGFALTALGVLVQYGLAAFYVGYALTGDAGLFADRLAIAAFAVLTGAALRFAAIQLTRLVPAEETP